MPPVTIRTHLYFRLMLGLLAVVFAVLVVVTAAGTEWVPFAVCLFGFVALGPWAAGLWRGLVIVDGGVLRVRDLRGWHPDLDLRRVRTARYSFGGRAGAFVTLSTDEVHALPRRRMQLVPRYAGVESLAQLDYPFRKLYRALAPYLLRPGVSVDDRLRRKLERHRPRVSRPG